MATPDTDRGYPSSYPRNTDQPSGRSPGARGIRRAFEEGSKERISAVSSRPNRRIGSPSTTSRAADRFDKMNIDDKDKDNDDSIDDNKTTEPSDEDMPSSARSRFKKDTSARSRAVENDGENDEKEGDDDAPKRSQKKATTGTGPAKKRKERKNLREKRRSTGVVIMPGQPADPADEQAQAVAKNTAANMGGDVSGDSASAAEISNYQETITQLQDELADKVKELDTVRKQMDNLRRDNTRLKDENSALLRVVGSLSGTGGGR